MLAVDLDLTGIVLDSFSEHFIPVPCFFLILAWFCS